MGFPKITSKQMDDFTSMDESLVRVKICHKSIMHLSGALLVSLPSLEKESRAAPACSL